MDRTRLWISRWSGSGGVALAAVALWAGCGGTPPLEERDVGVVSQAVVPLDRTVRATVAVDAATHTITLSWPLDAAATGYNVARKSLGAAAWGAPVALPANATGYVDSTVANGQRYEYQIARSGATPGYTYLATGIDATLVDARGTVVLIVDNTFTNALANEITRLVDDLKGDGWKVLRHDVARNASVPSVKALITADVQLDPAVRTVFLLGHVPVPYSGQLNPDGHPDHQGAWPADLYYGALNTAFTDVSVNTVTATRVENRNIPGDGKFDQTFVPTVELEVGRVDLANMPAFAPRTETDLLRQYLDKDHAYRFRTFTLSRRALVNDNFGDFGGEAFAASGYRNFIADFGPANITAGPFFPALGTTDYLFSYGCGGGSYTSAGGVGTTADWAATDAKTAFTMLFGSYFGDWDVSNSFLRAPLATTTYGLTSAWSGRPQFYLQAMAIGETIGFGTRVTQNNTTYPPYNYGNQYVHVALMGDPTLRLHPVIPPASLLGTVFRGLRFVRLTIGASADSNIVGYHVYRADANGNYVRQTSTPVSGPTWWQNVIVPGTYRYMVRAVKREVVAAGTYYNSSQGLFTTAVVF